MSGSLDLFETSEADAAPGDGLHWPDVRGWLQAHPQMLLDDRSLLEEIGLRPHGRNVIEFGAAALTRLEAVVEREAGARREVEMIARANFAAQTQTHVAALDLMEARNHSDLARRLDAEAAQRRLTLEAARQATAAPAPSVHDLRPVAPPASPSTSPPPTASEPRRSLSEIDAWLDRPR